MQRFLKLALATLVLTSTAAAFAADNSLGTWKMNVEKSKYTPGPLPVKNVTSVREAAGDGVKVSNSGERSDGTAINATYTAKYDGSAATVSGTGAPYDTVSIKKISDNAFTYDAKSGKTKYHVHGRITVAAGGKTMTTRARGTDADGKPITVTLVYEKQ
ncbi:hypothetical protein [Occallatibacter savannae]|uniref:hypothetical protein n=1 Tax=Occallatibacter savannae TaxID=1002691 RepID=UPI000D688AAA|nr:hypothetical protein [Occallatibacter savannae]